MFYRRKIGWSVLVLLWAVTGCPGEPAQPAGVHPPEAAYRGREVQLIVPQSFNLPAVWELLIQEWTSQSGATIRWTEYDAHQNSSGELSASDSSGGQLILLPINQLADFDASFLSLPTNEEEFDSRNLFQGLRERALTRERRLVANPISVPVLLCYYRKDLLRQANLAAPQTWDDYHRLVESLANWAPGLTAVEPLAFEHRATTFFARSLAYCKHPENYSVWFDIDSARPTLNTPGFVKALEKTQQTWKLLPPEVVNYGPTECRQRILNGQAAIGLMYEPSSAAIVAHGTPADAQEHPRVEGIEIGICRLPGSRTVYNRNSKRWDTLPEKEVHAPSLCGFAGWVSGVVDRQNPFKNSAAANLLVSLNSPSLFDQAFANLPKSPCRESQLSYCASWFGPDLSAEEASEYCDSAAQSLRDSQLVFELPLTGAAEFRRAAAKELEPLLRGEANAEQVSSALQQSFEAIVERLGRDTVRDSHRRGLGLGSALKK